MSNNPTKQQANDHEREAFEQIAKEHNWHFEDDEDDALWLFFRDAWKAGRASTESSTHETKFVKAVKEAIYQWERDASSAFFDDAMSTLAALNAIESMATTNPTHPASVPANEREAFEKAYHTLFPDSPSPCHEPGFAASGYNLHGYEFWEIWQAARATHTPAPLDGGVVEHTLGMERAANQAIAICQPNGGDEYHLDYGNLFAIAITAIKFATLTQPRSDEGVVERHNRDMAMLIKRIAYRHSKNMNVVDTISDAMEYLKRNGLEGSVLRDEAALTNTASLNGGKDE